MPCIRKTFKAILFDMDGTLIDSTPAVVAHWRWVGQTHALDPALILASSHGRRTIEVLRDWVPHKATPEYVKELEATIPKEFGQDAKALPGALEMLRRLEELGTKWAIVTSGTMVLASSWVKIMEMPEPGAFVTGDTVDNGKPHPEPYLTGWEKLGLSKDAEVLAIEDAPAGVRSGKGAGCSVLGLLTTHTREQVEAAGADFIAEDLSKVKVVGGGPEGVELEFEIEGP